MRKVIGISTQTYDLAGAVIIRNMTPVAEASNREVRRRVTRTATLDGGCTMYDTGYSASDRNILVEVESPAKSLFDFLQRLCRTYDLLTICTEDGAFSAAPETCQMSGGKMQFRLLVKEALS